MLLLDLAFNFFAEAFQRYFAHERDISMKVYSEIGYRYTFYFKFRQRRLEMFYNVKRTIKIFK